MSHKTGWTAMLALISGAFFCTQISPAISAESKPACKVPNELTRLDRPLARVARRLIAHAPVRIVAIGSSSIAGAGASSPAASFPSRLEVDLKERFPQSQITVVNRGANGEIASDMIARFDSDVIAEKPDLVLWQVGSNSVLREHPLLPHGALIREGVKRLKATNADVVLINLQFAPKILAKHDAEGMVTLIDVAAKELNVGVFQRFSVMRHWREARGLPFETFITADGLHLNDWGYDCWARLLSGAVAEAATRPALSATMTPTAPVVPASTKPTP
jgi:lysophospholipase L1-like esterase